jgi:hypothetical protein
MRLPRGLMQPRAAVFRVVCAALERARIYALVLVRPGATPTSEIIIGGKTKRAVQRSRTCRRRAMGAVRVTSACQYFVLDPGEFEQWLNGTPAEARELAREYPPELMRIAQEGFDKKNACKKSELVDPL